MSGFDDSLSELCDIAVQPCPWLAKPFVPNDAIALVDGVPTVLQVLQALRGNFVVGKAWMAEEFLAHNDGETQSRFANALDGIPLTHEPHVEFKKRVPSAIGLIRTGDTTQYANLILESA